jgi:hypothetical protein
MFLPGLQQVALGRVLRISCHIFWIKMDSKPWQASRSFFLAALPSDFCR